MQLPDESPFMRAQNVKGICITKTLSPSPNPEITYDPEINTDPEEFRKFNNQLIKNSPGYQPFYFQLVKNGKEPVPENSWKNRRLSFDEAYTLMKQGYNIGIAGTDTDKLSIVDVDNMEAVGKTKPTLTVISRKRIGRHYFYFTDDEPVRGAEAIFKDSAKQNIPTDEAGEVRANWQYTVCAGSYVPCSEEEINRIPEEDRENAGKYQVFIEVDVAEITFRELPEVYQLVIEEKRERAILAKLRPKIKLSTQHKDKRKSALWDLDIHDVTGRGNDPGKRFEMFPEIHGSETGKNASVSGDVLHCWRHMCCHNAITYLAVIAGLYDCSRAGYPHGGGSSSVDMNDPYTCFTIWKKAKDLGLLPEHDPIPYQGLVYYALEKKLCIKRQLINGWKLPMSVPHLAVILAAKEGLDLGR